MSFHTLIEYLKHRLKARGRHGTHSPFVYAFIEQVLQNHAHIGFREKLENYFSGYSIISPKDWTGILPVKNDKVIILLEGIHQTSAHTSAWQNLCNDERVKMSIDMYTYGMLLFLNEFKEKQHFILKYSG